MQRGRRLERVLEVHRVYKGIHDIGAGVARLANERQAEEVKQAQAAFEVLRGGRVCGERQARLEASEPLGVWRDGEIESGGDVLDGGRPGDGTRVLDVENTGRGVNEVDDGGGGGIDGDPGSVAGTVGDTA